MTRPTCGVTTPLATDGAVPTATIGRYQPLSVGASWVYQVTDTNNVAYTKTSTVTAFEDVGGAFAGTMAYKTSETVKSSTQYTWYQVTDTDVRRLHDQSLDSSGTQSTDDWYTPYNLRIDETPEHLTAGAAWQLTYTDAHTSAKKPAKTTTVTENWSCDAVNETVTVPAGTFSAVRITRTDTSSGGLGQDAVVRARRRQGPRAEQQRAPRGADQLHAARRHQHGHARGGRRSGQPVVGDLLGDGRVRNAQQPGHRRAVAVREVEQARDVGALERFQVGRLAGGVDVEREEGRRRGPRRSSGWARRSRCSRARWCRGSTG